MGTEFQGGVTNGGRRWLHNNVRELNATESPPQKWRKWSVSMLCVFYHTLLKGPSDVVCLDFQSVFPQVPRERI